MKPADRICCVTYRSIRSLDPNTELRYNARKTNTRYHTIQCNNKTQCKTMKEENQKHCTLCTCSKVVLFTFNYSCYLSAKEVQRKENCNFIVNTVSIGGFSTPYHTLFFSGSSSPNTHARVSLLKCVICYSDKVIEIVFIVFQPWL